jgi:DNA polymerase-4
MFIRTFYLRGDPSACLGGFVVERPLAALFLDMDSYFASVEQHLDPSLRGRPVGVAPVMAESSSCIAASYEAKAFGVKTGTGIAEARKLCPGIAIVESKPGEYIRFHHRIVEAVEDCIHVEEVLSIDEMWAVLPTNLREPRHVKELDQTIKGKIRDEVSPVITMSLGAAPNKYLAKMASKMRKPNGMLIIEEKDLPGILHGLALKDMHGIGKNMELRLRANGIHTVQELCAASKPALHAAWGGVQGDRLWYLLRGEIIPDIVTSRKSLGHSHVLPPEARAPERAWPVLCKLLHKACERMRSHGLLAGCLTMQLSFLRGGAWASEIRTPETDVTLRLLKMLDRLWRERPEQGCGLLKVGVLLSRLVTKDNYTPELFSSQVADAMAEPNGDGSEKMRKLDETVDRLRARFGRHCVFYGNIQEFRDHAPMRISFGHVPVVETEGD